MCKRLLICVVLLVLGLVTGSANADLVAYWEFEDDLTDSAGSNHGSEIGGPLTYIAGKIG